MEKLRVKHLIKYFYIYGIILVIHTRLLSAGGLEKNILDQHELR